MKHKREHSPLMIGGIGWELLGDSLSVAFNCVTVKVVGSLHQHVKVMQRELFGDSWAQSAVKVKSVGRLLQSSKVVQHSVERSP